MSEPRAQALPVRTLAFAALFVLSGACALTYEIVWSRMLIRVFGVTAFAVSTVLVSFMGGMALGAALLGRRAERTRRPLRLFALLEAGIGVYALILPLLLRAAEAIYGHVFPLLPDELLVRSAVRFAFSLSLLLVPAVLMGATLPALGQGLLGAGQIGRGIGLLYFVNTLGAALGCYLAGFALIPWLGLSRTTWLAAAINGLIAVTAWILDLRLAPLVAPGSPGLDQALAHGTGETAAAPLPEEALALASPAWWPLAVAFGSGALALAFEVVWFRVLVLVFGSTVYSFSAMLSMFLLGLALGSFWLGRWSDRLRRPVRLLALTLGGVAVFGLLGSLAVNYMPGVFLRVLTIFGFDFDGMARTKLLLSFLTLFPPAVAFGGTFPVAVRLEAARGRGVGSRIGRVYAWNTLGAIVGSFLAGFVLLPTIGAERTLQGIVVGALLLAFGSLLAERGPIEPRWALPAGLVAVVVATVLVFAPRWDRRLLGAGVYFEPRQYFDAAGRIRIDRVVSDYTLMTYTEGFNETIISFRSPKGKFITVNGSTTASDQLEDMFAQRMLGHLPMALHAGPVRNVCVVGLGAGVTAGAIGLHEAERVVGLELERGVFVASRFFADRNHDVLRNPRLDVRIDDGRNWLEMDAHARFDVISSHANFPSLTGSGALFSREYYQLCSRRLAPGGLACLWVPLWRLHAPELKSILGTFADVFPHVRVFSTGMSLVVLGANDPFPPVDVAELRRRVGRPKVAASLAEIGIRGPVELLSFYMMDGDELRNYAQGARRNTDDYQRVEFYAPRGLFSSTVGDNLAGLVALRPAPERRAARLGLTGEYAESYRALASGYDATVAGHIHLAAGRVRQGLDWLIPAAESGQRYARYLVADHAVKTGGATQNAGNLAGAREQFAMAVRFEPDNLEALVGLGFTSIFTGDLAGAEQALGRATELYPRSAGALYRLGFLRMMQERLDEAERLFRVAIDIQPILSPPHALLGHLLLASGRAQEAALHFEEAVRLEDSTEGPYVGLAEAYLLLGRPGEALVAARNAARLFPSSPDAFDVLARAADAESRPDEATSARQRRESLERQRTTPAQN